ncbi:MAG: 16S rRNA (cytidine(1402)-2'-O)-methyltransferase [Sulfuricaulis sp.]|uniref:16S rRNA (cytidine(1402)-2'-O)-methyltransferase n=1 Tax=Sulfuricaulis sp. TaxID=2003553 RepID=UPI0025FB4D91|nr:16S rRNA (cytidine(1402)-2'-O)-methyltransferase [Sulfuricaulis sp.]MCR4347580.1 16S rRNA (cytidine(1402)-2'-O)-methyltransferase [Sulfuricaulis sp.]
MSHSASINQGTLYVVATPIGNLEDMAPRAVRTLSEVDLIAAEDTRHSGKLLRHFGIGTKTEAIHEHNERNQVPRLIEILKGGKSIAFITDAGTPLVSDPGFHLVRAARQAGIRVTPVPGACAAIAALSAAGLPSDRFVFEGFPPAKSVARRAVFEKLCEEGRTLIFYESPHRILESLKDMSEVFGDGREAVLARELTKQFETLHSATLAELLEWVGRDANQQLGEFVILIHGVPRVEQSAVDEETGRVLKILLEELPVKQAAALAAKITGLKKNKLYEHALALKRDGQETSEI